MRRLAASFCAVLSAATLVGCLSHMSTDPRRAAAGGVVSIAGLMLVVGSAGGTRLAVRPWLRALAVSVALTIAVAHVALDGLITQRWLPELRDRQARGAHRDEFADGADTPLEATIMQLDRCRPGLRWLAAALAATALACGLLPARVTGAGPAPGSEPRSAR
ncbi:MAG: hypothetical protein CHACPFDD_03813 [Phycisphaerae bacterium]|nr:hypothetical protein [Phycisphaerae bacterium]